MTELNQFIGDHLLVLFVITFLVYALIRLSTVAVSLHFFDFINLYAIYASFAASGIVAIALLNGNPVLSLFVFEVLLWFVGFGFGTLFFSYKHDTAEAKTKSVKKRSNTDLSIPWLLVYLVYGYYLFLVLSIFKVGSFDLLYHKRYLVFESARLFSYIFYSIAFFPPLLIVIKNPTIRWNKFFLCILPFWIVQMLTFSKTGILFILVAYSVRITISNLDKIVFSKTSIKMACKNVAYIFAILLIVFLVQESLPQGAKGILSFICYRLYSGFDSLVMLSEFNILQLPDLSLFQFYFAPVLKALGMYKQQYNAANYFLGIEYFGFPIDSMGLLPNNNLVMELNLTLHRYLVPVIIFVYGFFYGYLYKRSLKWLQYRGLWFWIASYVLLSPLAPLIDGQSWFGNLLAILLLYLIAVALNSFKTLILRLCKHEQYTKYDLL